MVQYSPGDEDKERSASRSLSPMTALLQEEEQDEKDETIKQLQDLVNSLKTEIVALKTVNSYPNEDEDNE